MDEYAQSIIKTEIAKHVKAQWEHWSNQYEFKQQIKVLLSERLQEEVERVLADYEGIKQRAEAQIHRSIATRVTNTVKKLEEV